ncbi:MULTISPECIES: iron ABC transporter ATP-binding protein [unclassified Rhodococcus (in: high G+C Gram-positive bacteria)]|uniref:iron ABC transporter ATP-binding protein n=1 Tax=unclassified Rhodococcus (in: high G+C Gram-positive bacteria) TaxID=192944 RepID=UPI000929762E|nr:MULTISPECIES: ATP-binding cassette domain-containing protein [unclassified Rhodococcus (in: high G+C Gram-positive bacteria)]NCL74348.1 Iron(3+)-hydroxamate import ATP-binding protein FhuC [Rhodococcus sp. YH1]OLL19303.1 iron ABC transporter ATP-binding protein [Rhodococcus sp. M8]QIX52345.1 ATP-binding cassette domain-containing protein [Rhodococcus sp. DMU1]QPG43130.1 ATP-binding cassette domain-containing protein [Rhodococcus sp. M8]
MITVRDLAKNYAGTTVLGPVDLDVPRGGLTSIIGANGAGKSTLLTIVARLLDTDAGSVSIDGLDLRATPSDALAKKLSVLRQDNTTAVRLSVRELVEFGRFPHSKGRLSAACHDAVDRALEYTGLGGFEHRFLDQLSGGQRQRAFVAMVLAQDTDYVLLDEPLNNLDMKHSQHMMQLLRRMAHEMGKTVILVIHDINFASCHSDRIVAMRDGAVVADGDVDEILQPEVLRKVYDMDIAVHEIDGRRIAVYF